MKSKTNFRAIYTLFVALVMSLACLGFTSISATVAQAESSVVSLTGEGNSDNPYLISNLEELEFFRNDVNNGNDYDGKYVKLTDNIDLNNEEWTPIGYLGKSFLGNFDGGNFTIKNLKITKTTLNSAENNGIGLFGKTLSPATIKNFTIENVDITGSLYVGAIVGYPYTGKFVENVTVKGDIAIDAWWYAGGIGGNGYISKVDNCHVIGNDGSYIKGNNGSYIGGIWGFRGEGSQTMTNCSVTNVAIIGVDRVAGISGIGHYGNSITNCSANNVSVTATDPDATTVGLVVGACQGGNGGNAITVIKDNNLENVNVKIGDVVLEKPPLFGTNIDGIAPETNLVACVNGVFWYESIADAVAVSKFNDVITLLKDTDEECFVPAGIKVNADGYSVENVTVEELKIANIIVSRSETEKSTTVSITYLNSDGITTFTVYDGQDGFNGQDGTNGTNGTNGKDGKDGIGIKNAEVNENGELIITYTDNTFINLGVVVGANGTNGTNGVDGVNGKDGQNTSNGFAITATVIGAIALLSNIAMLLFFFLKKRA